MDQLKKKISYWYMRYLLVTELFMVEIWERNMFHVIALILLTILGLFNYFLVLGGVRFMRHLYFHYTTDIENIGLHESLELRSTEL